MTNKYISSITKKDLVNIYNKMSGATESKIADGITLYYLEDELTSVSVSDASELLPEKTYYTINPEDESIIFTDNCKATAGVEYTLETENAFLNGITELYFWVTAADGASYTTQKIENADELTDGIQYYKVDPMDDAYADTIDNYKAVENTDYTLAVASHFNNDLIFSATPYLLVKNDDNSYTQITQSDEDTLSSDVTYYKCKYDMSVLKNYEAKWGQEYEVLVDENTLPALFEVSDNFVQKVTDFIVGEDISEEELCGITHFKEFNVSNVTKLINEMLNLKGETMASAHIIVDNGGVPYYGTINNGVVNEVRAGYIERDDEDEE